MRFLMKQKIFSLRDSFEIFDEHNELAYIAKGSFFSFLRKSLTLKDAQENEVAQIKQKLLAIKPTFFIRANDGVTCRIKKCFFPLFSSKFIISTPGSEVVLTGDFLSHEYRFEANGEEIAAVSKHWFSFGDTYGVDIKYDEDIWLILSSIAVIDMIMHDDSGSVGSD